MSDRLQVTHVSGNINYLDLGPEDRRYYILTDAQVRKWRNMSPDKRAKLLAQKKADGEYKLKGPREVLKAMISDTSVPVREKLT